MLLESGIGIKDLIDVVHETNFNPLTNTIYLTGDEGSEEEPGIEYAMALRFIRNLDLAKLINPLSGLNVELKSCGGCTVEGMAIYDAIRAYPLPVTITNWTGASSMTSLILLAGDYRVMMPHSHYMFHDGSLEFEGTIKQFKTEHEWVARGEAQYEDIYLQALRGGSRGHCTDAQNRKWLRKQLDTKEEVYLMAHEAVELGFADWVWEPECVDT